MGIAFNVGKRDMKYGEYASWSYGGFNRFRVRLAESIGFVLDNLEGFNQTGKNIVKWDTMKDGIKPLLNHSDCDGELTPKECAKVAQRLREIVSAWTSVEDEYDKRNGLLLADMMDECVAKKVPLIFC